MYLPAGQDMIIVLYALYLCVAGFLYMGLITLNYRNGRD